MNNNQLTNFLRNLLVFFIIIAIVLVIILIYLSIRAYLRKKEEKEGKKKVIKEEKTQSATAGYNRQSIFNFLEFEKIEDNMIIQKNKTKYLMVVECQGINYDLMSQIEKVGVEQGFIEFLNTLRNPIQIYIQTRTVNLGTSINTYKERVEEIGRNLNKMTAKYNELIHSSTQEITEEQIKKLQFEITKQRNLYEYGKDIVNSTERMSLNKNILRKYYYIIVPYYPEDIGRYDEEEIKGMAFSELYTNCQSMIQSLSSCGMNSKILNSNELAELLYVAYNRDESENYELSKAISAGYFELYTTAQDVLEKKMKELDNVIQERAKVLANTVIKEAVNETKLEREVREKERKMKDLTEKRAMEIIKENDTFLGEELTEKSLNKIDEMSQKRKGVLRHEINTEFKERRFTAKK